LTATKPAAPAPMTAIRLEGEFDLCISGIITIEAENILGDGMEDIETSCPKLRLWSAASGKACLWSPPRQNIKIFFQGRRPERLGHLWVGNCD